MYAKTAFRNERAPDKPNPATENQFLNSYLYAIYHDSAAKKSPKNFINKTFGLLLSKSDKKFKNKLNGWINI